MKKIFTRDEWRAFAAEIGVRKDWHEPDEQDITARVEGTHLDNAMGPGEWYGSRPSSAELHVIVSKTGTWTRFEYGTEVEKTFLVEDLAVVNLATLCAWASEPDTDVADLRKQVEEARREQIKALGRCEGLSEQLAEAQDRAADKPKWWRLIEQPMSTGASTSRLQLPEGLTLQLETDRRVPWSRFPSKVDASAIRYEDGACLVEITWKVRLWTRLEQINASFRVAPDAVGLIGSKAVVDPEQPWSSATGKPRTGVTATLSLLRLHSALRLRQGF